MAQASVLHSGKACSPQLHDYRATLNCHHWTGSVRCHSQRARYQTRVQQQIDQTTVRVRAAATEAPAAMQHDRSRPLDIIGYVTANATDDGERISVEQQGLTWVRACNLPLLFHRCLKRQWQLTYAAQQ